VTRLAAKTYTRVRDSGLDFCPGALRDTSPSHGGRTPENPNGASIGLKGEGSGGVKKISVSAILVGVVFFWAVVRNHQAATAAIFLASRDGTVPVAANQVSFAVLRIARAGRQLLPGFVATKTASLIAPPTKAVVPSGPRTGQPGLDPFP